MLNIGPWELLLILLIVLIVFGPGKLPEVARTMGKAVNEFRRASSGVQRVWEEVTREVPEKPAQPHMDKNEGPLLGKEIFQNDVLKPENAGGDNSAVEK